MSIVGRCAFDKNAVLLNLDFLPFGAQYFVVGENRV